LHPVLDVEPGVAIARRLLDAHRDSADGVDQVFETLEVDLEIVMDGDAECARHGAHHDRRRPLDRRR